GCVARANIGGTGHQGNSNYAVAVATDVCRRWRFSIPSTRFAFDAAHWPWIAKALTPLCGHGDRNIRLLPRSLDRRHRILISLAPIAIAIGSLGAQSQRATTPSIELR